MNMTDDMVMLKDGKMVIVRNSGTVPMKEEMTMPDGTRVMPNGQVLKADGTARMMREGESMSLGRDTSDPEGMSDAQFREEMEDEESRDDIK